MLSASTQFYFVDLSVHTILCVQSGMLAMYIEDTIKFAVIEREIDRRDSEKWFMDYPTDSILCRLMTINTNNYSLFLYAYAHNIIF